jgi:hypothetical protein
VLNSKNSKGDFKMHKTVLLTVSACLLLMLTACDDRSADRQAILAAVPAHLRNCFGDVVTPRLPASGPISRRQIVTLVAQLRESEVARTQCGRQLLAFYDAQASVYNRPMGLRLPFFR